MLLSFKTSIHAPHRKDGFTCNGDVTVIARPLAKGAAVDLLCAKCHELLAFGIESQELDPADAATLAEAGRQLIQRALDLEVGAVIGDGQVSNPEALLAGANAPEPTDAPPVPEGAAS